MDALTKLKKVLKTGTQAEAKALALRITLLLDVGTYGSNPLNLNEEKEGI